MDYKREVLANGIDITITQVKDIPSVSIYVYTKVGSRFERTGQEGISHLVEHMLFKRTKNHPEQGALVKEVEALGGYFNAYTTYEHTAYYIQIPADNLSKGAKLLFDIITDTIFDESDLEIEKGVVLEEMRMYEDQVQDKLYYYFAEKLFQDNGLGKKVIGTAEDVRSIQVDDLYKYQNEYYLPKNMCISIAGNAQALQDNTKFLTELFSRDIKRTDSQIDVEQKMSEISVKRRKLDTEKVFLMSDKSEQQHIIIGGFAPRYKFTQIGALLLGNAVLSFGMSSLLSQRMRDDLGLTYYIGASTERYTEIGKYYVRFGCDPDKGSFAIDELMTVLRKFLTGDNFGNDELGRARNYLKGGIMQNLEGSQDIAEWFGSQMVRGLDELRTYDSFVEILENVAKEEILEVWSNIFADDNVIITAADAKQKLSNYEIPSFK